MSSYLSAKQDRGFSRFPFMIKGLATLGLSTFAVMLVQETATHRSEGYSSFQSSQTVPGSSDAGFQQQKNAFLEAMKSGHPSSFKLDENGKAQITIALQSFYTCTVNGNQEIVTSKSTMKEQVVFQLNQKHISYNVKEGLGMWTIQWNDQLFIPAL